MPDIEYDPRKGAGDQAALIKAISRGAIKLQPPDTAKGFADLACLDPLFADARIVGLGEASHGSHTLTAIKSRLARYLVEKHGFTVIALEACWCDPSTVERYLSTGRGGAAYAARRMFAEWATADDLELIRWAHAHNAQRRGRAPVIITSMDLLQIADAVSRLGTYVGRLRPPLHEAARDLVAPTSRWQMGQPPGLRKRQKIQAAKLVAWLDSHRAVLTRQSGSSAFREARHAARLLWQVCNVEAGDFWPERDRAMAENLQWLAEERYPGQKIVVLAHNGHVGLLPFSGGQSLGERLRGRYGSRYVIVGTTFYAGSIRVMRMNSAGDMAPEPTRLTVKAANSGRAEDAFEETGVPCFALDLRHARKDDLLGRWLYNPQTYRDIGNGYNPAKDDEYTEWIMAPLVYDAIVFASRSTPQRPADLK